MGGGRGLSFVTSPTHDLKGRFEGISGSSSIAEVGGSFFIGGFYFQVLYAFEHFVATRAPKLNKVGCLRGHGRTVSLGGPPTA